MRRCDPDSVVALAALLARYGLTLMRVPDDAPIPGSYWGESEAGIVGTTVNVRSDTPVHSVLHEAAHVICMDDARRARLDTEAGGDYAEEDAVCFLQIVLARTLDIAPGALCADMDTWGYTFRLGSARQWFEQDADDARHWLAGHGLITAAMEPTWRLRHPRHADHD